MKKLRVYLDTSVISFVYADDSPEKQSVTQEFFDSYLGLYDVWISPVVLAEIENARDAKLRKKLQGIVRKYKLQILEMEAESQEAIYSMAQRYVKEKVIPASKFDDAMHIAICVYHEFDILLSWNFRHLANITKQIQVNAVNRKEGYLKDLFLLNPMEVLYEKE